MSKSVKSKIEEKLKKLKEFLKILHELQKVNKKSFLEDYHSFGLAERYFHLSIEAILDVGRIVITELELEMPYENEEIISTLTESKIITESLYGKMSGMARFRNLLVHEYIKIDRREVYKHLQTKLKVFEEYDKQIKKFLKKIATKK
jgi:uncharacterized protein YutE (UPF0331/DUF86 family)